MTFHVVRLALCVLAVLAAVWWGLWVDPWAWFAVLMAAAAGVLVAVPVALSLEGLGVLAPSVYVDEELLALGVDEDELEGTVRRG